jgi:site-specific DNA-methyltransferase (adenine-specific)
MSLPSPYFDDGTVTIYHGDCREILPLLEYDCIVTDPPYGIGYAAQPTKWQRRTKMQSGGGRSSGKGWRGDATKVIDTSETWDDSAVNDVVDRIVSDPRPAIIWGGNYYALPPRRGWLCWFKPDAPPSMGSFELAWTNLDRNTRLISCSISQTNGERLGHPNQKPQRVMAWCLAFVDGAICDPFLGSGTTLRVAKDAGRRAIGIEREERYCEMAARRMSQQTLFGAGA